MYCARVVAVVAISAVLAACSYAPTEPHLSRRAMPRPSLDCIGDSVPVYGADGNLTGYTDSGGIHC